MKIIIKSAFLIFFILGIYICLQFELGVNRLSKNYNNFENTQANVSLLSSKKAHLEDLESKEFSQPLQRNRLVFSY